MLRSVKCPKCGKTENIKVVCRNCDHEYGAGWFIFSVLLVFLIVAWAVFTLTYHAVYDKPIEDVIRGEWNFITEMFTR